MNYICGKKPVLEALKSNVPIDKIYIAENQHGEAISQIKKSAGLKKIVVKEIPFKKLELMTAGVNAQGVAAVKSFIKYLSLDELLSHAGKKEKPVILILDSIQDPHNLGAILRTAECSGVDGVIITIHKSASINETVEKVSAGAVSHLKICQVNNLVNSIKELKKAGFWIAGSHLDDESINYTDFETIFPLALVLGNEEKGIRKLVSENCDFLIKIPMMGKIQSLNVSVSAGILLFEILKKK